MDWDCDRVFIKLWLSLSRKISKAEAWAGVVAPELLSFLLGGVLTMPLRATMFLPERLLCSSSGFMKSCEKFA